MSYPAPPPASSGQPPAPSANSFFSDLFDVRFTRFVSLQLISIVYILILIVASLVALATIFTGFAAGPGVGIFVLILAVLLWVVFVVLARVGLETFAVLFRIHDDTSRMADALAGGRPAAPSSTSPPPAPPATTATTGSASTGSANTDASPPPWA
jgi:hypothetical protein